jgi:hypothetical protein
MRFDLVSAEGPSDEIHPSADFAVGIGELAS